MGTGGIFEIIGSILKVIYYESLNYYPVTIVIIVTVLFLFIKKWQIRMCLFAANTLMGMYWLFKTYTIKDWGAIFLFLFVLFTLIITCIQMVILKKQIEKQNIVIEKGNIVFILFYLLLIGFLCLFITGGSM